MTGWHGKRNALLLGAGLIVGTGLGLIFLIGFQITATPSSTSNEEVRAGVSLPAPNIGSPAPDFSINLLNGDTFNLKENQGRTILLNFWATWCAPCRLEMPVFQEYYQQARDDLLIAAINNAEEQTIVQEYVDELGLSFPILLDDDASIQRLYRVRGYPTTLLIDSQGIIQVYHVGILTEQQLEQYLLNMGVAE
jgi:cytochrome c biogenesis protein CcmG, thiol:disulfide interchange protein DsbE